MGVPRPVSRSRRARAALLCAAMLAACTPPPGSGGPSLLAPRFSEAQEIRAGQRAAREATRAIGLVADQELQDYVQQVGARLARASERSQLPWTFRVLDDPMPNAFALPGGYVFVTRGLLGVIESEAELAGVLAHSIGHVNARHGVRELARQPGAQLGLWAAPVAELRALDGGAAAGGGLLFTEYRADAERQANDMGLRYALAADYDIREMADVFSALGRVEAIGGRSALPPWLATHADPGGLVESAAERVGGALESPDSLRLDRFEYLDQIEDLVYGHDPRQGYFRGSTFIHPELRFRIELPSGWSYRNLAQVVVAASPERDAAMQLSIIEQVTPDEAADRYLAQPGVSATGNVTTDTVNANAVVSVPFRAATSAGIATGVATWIGFGSRTYQIVGLAGQAANGHEETFRQSVRSFAGVTDRRLVDVRPNRINIVRLGRATTFGDFNRRYPSVVEAEQVALLNRVAGPGSRLRAGGRVKRVVKG